MVRPCLARVRQTLLKPRVAQQPRGRASPRISLARQCAASREHLTDLGGASVVQLWCGFSNLDSGMNPKPDSTGRWMCWVCR